jgi:hypothetical protein
LTLLQRPCRRNFTGCVCAITFNPYQEQQNSSFSPFNFLRTRTFLSLSSPTSYKTCPQHYIQ